MEQDDNSGEMRRFKLGMDILARLDSEYFLPHITGEEPKENNTGVESENVAIPWAASAKHQPLYMPQAITLSACLAALQPIPESQLLVGLCDDGLPILMDLQDAQSGSILILGEKSAGKTRLLTSMLVSAIQINPARKLRICTISPRLDEISGYLNCPHCYKLFSPYESGHGSLIRELAATAEQRRYGRESGAAILLFIDGLSEAISSLDEDEYDALIWLIQNGPASHIWTIATLNPDQMEEDEDRLMDFFGTWLVGTFCAGKDTPNLTRIPEDVAQSLVAGQQFSIFFNGEWVRFTVPALE